MVQESVVVWAKSCGVGVRFECFVSLAHVPQSDSQMMPRIGVVGVVFEDLLEEVGRLGEFSQFVLALGQTKGRAFEAGDNTQGLKKSALGLGIFPRAAKGIGKVEPAFAKARVGCEGLLIAFHRRAEIATAGKNGTKVGPGLFVNWIHFKGFAIKGFRFVDIPRLVGGQSGCKDVFGGALGFQIGLVLWFHCHDW
jgi:hypothetical protein